MLIGSAYGRFGTAGLRGRFATNWLRKDFPAGEVATVTAGTAMKLVATPTLSYGILSFLSGTTHQVSVGYALDGRLTVYSGSVEDGVVLAKGTTPISQSVWYYIEMQATFDGTTGQVTVKVDGATDIDTTGDTDPAATGTAGALYLCGGASGAAIDTNWDDVYVRDDATFLGDIRVRTLMPTGAGAHSDFIPSGLGAYVNWENVDEVPPAETDYNSSATVGAIDTFTHASIPVTSTVHAVQQHLWAAKDNSGIRQIAPLQRIGGTDYPGTTYNLPITGSYRTEMFELNPADSASWEPSDVNAAEFGYKVTG